MDTHGDQSAGVELRPPVIHPTFEARYFFKKEMEKRDEWSRDLSKEEVKRKHWFQQYDRSRRFLLYGGFGEDGCGLADVWELRLIFDPTRLMIVKEGDTLNLPPGLVCPDACLSLVHLHMPASGCTRKCPCRARSLRMEFRAPKNNLAQFTENQYLNT